MRTVVRHPGKACPATRAALLALVSILGGCATALPQAEVDDSYRRCVGERSSLQAVYCNRAIESEKLDRQQLIAALETRSRINEDRGRRTEADIDRRRLAELTGDRRWLPPEPARPVAPPVPVAPRRYQLVYNGMVCARVQRDSMFNPANEIFANVVVVMADGSYKPAKVPARGLYRNVRAGARRAGNGQVVWSGEDQPLTVQISAWEVDDGGPMVEKLTGVAVDFALTRGQKTLMRGAVRNPYARAAGNRAAGEAMEVLDLSDQFAHHLSSIPKALVGANNDALGSVGMRNVHPGRYGAPARPRDGYPYHLMARLGRGGADCRFYFVFR